MVNAQLVPGTQQEACKGGPLASGLSSSPKNHGHRCPFRPEWVSSRVLFAEKALLLCGFFAVSGFGF